MFAESISVTLNPHHHFTALALAHAIHSFSSFSSTDSLAIARLMLKGEIWRPEPSALKMSDSEAVNPNFHRGWFDFKIEQPPNPYKEQGEKWAAQRAILMAGAAGDVEAAILYCQMELNGEINHGPMG